LIYLKKGEKIVKLLPSSTSVEEHATRFEDRRNEANAKKVVWKVERVDPPRNRCAT